MKHNSSKDFQVDDLTNFLKLTVTRMPVPLTSIRTLSAEELSLVGGGTVKIQPGDAIH
jgi:hypothetical protein